MKLSNISGHLKTILIHKFWEFCYICKYKELLDTLKVFNLHIQYVIMKLNILTSLIEPAYFLIYLLFYIVIF